jgi:hypothetical protein
MVFLTNISEYLQPNTFQVYALYEKPYKDPRCQNQNDFTGSNTKYANTAIPSAGHIHLSLVIGATPAIANWCKYKSHLLIHKINYAL